MDSEKEDYYFSVVDVIGVLTESSRARKYWSDLKNKLKNEGSELGLLENMKVAKRGGSVAKGARNLYEKGTRRTAISSNNALNYKYADKNLIKNK